MITKLNETNETPMCGFCNLPILETDTLNVHHIRPRSEGGSDHDANLTPAHVECHRNWHKTPGADGLNDFQRWGRLSSTDCHWAFYLRGVKDNPAYESARNFYRLFYGDGRAERGRQ